MLLTNAYFIAIGVPLLLILCGALAKKLVRGSGWLASDFFLGVELALSAMASGLVFLFDVNKNGSVSEARITPAAIFLVICFFLLMLMLTIHQDWEKRTQNPNGQIFWLGVFTNLIGASLLASFVLLVKGI